MTIQSRLTSDMLTGNVIVRRVVHGILAASALAALSVSAPALAQQAPAPADQELKEIVVTGSLLRRVDIESPSPVTIMTAEDIQKTGLTTIADVVRTLSADNSGTLPTAFGNAFAAGASGVALRGLTVNSTLVLIDGRRAANYAVSDDGERSFVDLNTIPLESVDHIEVLKDGASSIYGADAIAGVVNVITKKSYQGGEVTAEIGKDQHPGGGSRRIAGIAGSGDLSTDKYNAYIAVEFQQDDRILVSDRSFPFNTNNLSSIGGFNELAGPPGSGAYGISPAVAPATFAPGTAGTPVLNSTQVGAFQPLNGCAPQTTASSAPSAITGLTDNYCTQNRTAYGDDQPQQTRVGMSAHFTVALSDKTTASIVASYFQSKVVVDNPPSQINAATPINTNNIALPATLPSGALNPNDPFAAAGENALIEGAFGNIQNQSTYFNHNMRLVTDLKGSMGTWDFDTGLVVNHTWLDSTINGFISGPALISAVTNGTYNFLNPAANSAATIAALSPSNARTSTSDLDAIDFSATTEAAQLAGGPLGLALGAQLRYEAEDDPQLNPNNTYQGFGVSQAIGSRTVAAAFGEANFPFVKQFEVDVSARFDHYSDFGNAFTPKAGFKFTPIPEFALRGTYSQGFRAPSFAENGSSEAGGFVTVSPSEAPFPANYCPNTAGLPPQHSAAYCLPYALESLSLANPDIKPEKSDSFTFGAIVEPNKVFSATFDYYFIRKTNVIEPPNIGPALGAYLSGQPIPAGYTVVPDVPDPAFPASLARPILIGGDYENAASLQTDGVDIELRGKFDIGAAGRFTTEIQATKIFSWNITQGGVSEQYVGTQAPYILSSGAGTPRYRATWTNSWEDGPMTLTLSTYYVSGYAETAVDALGNYSCAYNNVFCHVASFTYSDLNGIYKFNDHFSAAFTVGNILDKLPPIDPLNYAGVNYNPTYTQAGIIGRYLKIGATYKF
jgi:iron complex outermembrane recepter protein